MVLGQRVRSERWAQADTNTRSPTRVEEQQRKEVRSVVSAPPGGERPGKQAFQKKWQAGYSARNEKEHGKVLPLLSDSLSGGSMHKVLEPPNLLRRRGSNN